ncbi:hypothetical protein PGH07_04915 [Sulfurovum sp. zt1-1]|uniref:Uncharacterized protein n=1 Tax=Sulfurovum zhangzhouensis TaxID=3019067 RepID=A0ABT7QXF8_9BACT|nr:hypothetical protein [Sulfurovum zhangzhouensis]MDM5271510.1 hypothetical protein [Sulfurovum zhangzhouensis]
MPEGDNLYYYLAYAIVVVVFIVVLKMPKKKKDEHSKKGPVSTSKKFNKDIEDQQNKIKDI